MVHETWLALPEMFPRVRLDQMVIMPEHVHAVLVLRDYSASPAPLGEVIRYWKGVTRTRLKVDHPEFRWRVGFYDRIIRSQRALTVVRRYIQQNPANYRGPWAELPAKPPNAS
jgi:putative transposase